jgi:hypothetical protein
MFDNNKYTSLYYRIINNATSKNRIKRRTTHKNYEYFESHHIVPRSLGGVDTKENLVLLTPREHFICHYLLCKMVKSHTYQWNKLVRAFTFMYASSTLQNRYMNSRLYEFARKSIGTIMSKSQSGSSNSQYGKVWVSNILKMHSCKIDSKDLDTYIKNGYIQKRVISWDKFIIEQCQETNELQKAIQKINNKINQLNQEKEILMNKLESIKLNMVPRA